jgi:hypothetical protein
MEVPMLRSRSWIAVVVVLGGLAAGSAGNTCFGGVRSWQDQRLDLRAPGGAVEMPLGALRQDVPGPLAIDTVPLPERPSFWYYLIRPWRLFG